MKLKPISAEEFDRIFDEGEEDILPYLDMDSARPVSELPQLIAELNTGIKRVNVDFPQWVVEGLDTEAQRLGVSRQSVIKTWIAERLDQRTT